VTIDANYMTIDGLETYVRTAGSRGAPAVLLVHGGGMGTSSTVWHYVMPELAKTHFVIAADAPGFGFSGTPQGPLDVGVIAAHLIKLLDKLGVDRTSLVGHSMGGQIAMRITAEHPERVNRLALVAIGGRSLGLTYDSPGMALMDSLAVDPDPAKIRELVETLNARRDHVIEEEVNERTETAKRPGVLEAQRKLRAARVNEKAGQAERARVLIDKLKASGVPIMLLWGSQERLNPVDLGERIAKVLDWAEYHLIEGAGHNIPNDKPEKANKLLVGFLNG
jgi:4,5:9,10-diseco-3-hydroxy-5,9,17-trioxoandrosta-1(10),2-diene-4-oate hydrolase